MKLILTTAFAFCSLAAFSQTNGNNTPAPQLSGSGVTKSDSQKVSVTLPAPVPALSGADNTGTQTENTTATPPPIIPQKPAPFSVDEIKPK